MTKAEVKKAFQKWEKGPRFEYVRFGQWFLNTYFPGVPDNALFYKENDNQALRDIMHDPRYMSVE